ncbi:PTS sugar transporter subunit IIA [Clostridium grantii]|uniref:PTS system IIA component, Fru family n=1 Tax=Clostridium grantii DSM 8605 TaxID=1121316 RepID=A0A1M5UUJ0_9CLOT|nr:fructose PTS transporter subunit IIA [Clostridium grantii]SHH66614.1 PTS system IIA component, Fru family [Clostridium grantii DSM 8605]
MEISNLINKNLINLEMNVDSREEAIKVLAEMMFNDGKLKSQDDYIVDVLEREKEGTTGFGMGFAIPHGKSDAVKETCFAAGRSAKGIEWNSLDGEPVNFVILIAVPKEEAGTTHLKILSQIASNLMEDDFRDNLLQAQLEEEVINILSREMEE